jgi:antitoxin component of RelBE/YafQ-DinJ toxin-antitoxin module
MKESTIMLRISNIMKDKFEEICKKKGISISEYLRMFILKEIEENEKNK